MIQINVLNLLRQDIRSKLKWLMLVFYTCILCLCCLMLGVYRGLYVSWESFVCVTCVRVCASAHLSIYKHNECLYSSCNQLVLPQSIYSNGPLLSLVQMLAFSVCCHHVWSCSAWGVIDIVISTLMSLRKL